MTTQPLLHSHPRTPALIVAFITLTCLRVWSTTFTNNTSITVGNTNYDGADIVVSNCTLTVDGPHGFTSLLVAVGGVLTHSSSPSGTVSNLVFVTNENQVLDGTNAVTLLDSNVVDSTVSVTDSTGTNFYINGADYLLSSTNGVFTQLQRTTNSTIPDGATVLVNYDSLQGILPAGVNLSITGNVEVDSGGAILANGTGYAAGNGPGAGSSAGAPLDGSGGGYGGIGGTSSSNALGGVTYGAYYSPTNLGSGGGSSYLGGGGPGGGLINITAGGSVIINGSVSANGGNGTNSRSGGGSGGGILITGLALSGNGALSANGGNGAPPHGGGGGGGRIALQFTASSFTGVTAAHGGAGSTIGGAGTVFTKLQGQNGLLVVDNNGQAGTNTTLGVSDSSINVQIQGKASVLPVSAWSVGNLAIASNGLLLASSLTTLNITAQGSITIETGGAMLANGGGYGPGLGSGHGGFFNDNLYRPCGGGGYGGNGASGFPTNGSGGLAYGVQASPSGYGSGGGTFPPYSLGGYGGGAIQLISQGGVFEIDGTISANGGNGFGSGGGGGSGGTISLTGGALLGSGSITVNGGAGADSTGGGGGGGRIFISSSANLFEGPITAYGGGGANWGGAGTVLIQASGQNAQLIVNNGGHNGTNTIVQSAQGADLIVGNGGSASASSTVSFGNLYVNSNGWLVPYFSFTVPAGSISFTLSGNATIQSGGGIDADLGGYGAGQGPGAGRIYSIGSSNVCSGAGHGGYGGNSFGNYAPGGTVYDELTGPIDPGSGGAAGSASSLGGSGGGVVRLAVSGTLEMDGLISANGGNGSGTAGGGGSGGSLWLSAGTFAGAGSIAANGGNGVDAVGGGGGGGLIYITCNNNSFVGALSDYGGAGANHGGAGLQLIQATGKNTQVVVDGGGNQGPATPVPSSGTIDLTLRNGAVGGLANNGSVNLGNVLIGSNSWLVVSNSTLFMTFSTATIQAGGGIIADSQGYGANGGSGAGHFVGTSPYYPGSGAGHGGLGGSSFENMVAGGVAYDSQTSPNGLGSGGGGYLPYSIGGNGGGGFVLTVSGLLQLDGLISANGGNGAGVGGGGGSGGGIKITAGTLAGAGSIQANGGAGAGSIGGGGGGGCIALYPTTDLFTGTISACGGGGANWGGAGTIYIQPTGQSPQFIVDNGGQSGASTPIQPILPSSAVILRNGGVAYQQTPGQTFASLQIGSNAWLTATPSSNGPNAGIVNLIVTGTATVQAGGGIVTDNSSLGGSGAGHSFTSSPSFPCSGGGYGGDGGNSTNNLAIGGSVYGSIISPVNNGSSGGGYSTFSFGGLGGGSIRLNVNGTLNASGRISARGGNGSGTGGGGGSGGGIFLSVGALAGSGAISANGGNGVVGVGGGGGGGRISISYIVNSFVGQTAAHGGSGYADGGAGTIYTKANNQSVGQVLVDNGGLAGTNTPVSAGLGAPAQPFNLTIENGAVVSPQGTSNFPRLNNLTVGSGGLLTGSPGLSTFDLLVFSNVVIQSGGAIGVDGLGYSQTNGPGGGLSTNGFGSGAGYGGVGGASAAAAGGLSYGSALQPSDFGSGGGYGSGPVAGGSSGGGAIRLNVGGVLTVDGLLSAEGAPGLQDDSGGGSGGSIWVDAGILAGSGRVAADGGEGALYGGGGGAGGRIALYARNDIFYGQASALSGGGAFSGANGTIVFSNMAPLQIVSSSPTGIVNYGVSSVDLFFNEAPNPSTFSPSYFSLGSPTPLPPGSITLVMVSSTHYQADFPLQTAVGNYSFMVSTNVNDLSGQPMPQAYTGQFTIVLPVIQGTVTDTNGQPVPGVLMQATAGLTSTTTDANGNYALGFVPGSSFTVTPSLGTMAFIPPSMSYVSAGVSISNQNYVAVSTIAPVLKATGNATNLMLSWQAIPGVTYQVYSSTDLINWSPYGDALSGTNALQFVVPIGANSMTVFRVGASN